MTTPQHDPERDAAAYLGGDLAPAGREKFEAHMLICDACWSEVSQARTGRALAEGLREAAPQDLRELLRAIASSPEQTGSAAALVLRPAGGRRRALGGVALRRLAATAAVVAVLGVGVALLIPQTADGEATLVAAASVFQADSREGAPAQVQPPVQSIAGMTYQGALAQPLAGQPALIYRYTDAAGHRVVLMSSTEEFPRAVNAQAIDPMGKNWIASVDGAQMLCVSHGGLSWLVISDSRDEALAAGREAGLM